jgi:hypothetical protein
MSKSNQAFSDELGPATTIVQESTDGERGGGGRHQSRMDSTVAKYRARRTISFDELKRRVLGR